uniref:Uncharacterized protein n=1 Tax=Mycena chlorophos TaxID=658473 RepID=A0ABQ0LNH7_MYCCL|nr:predicted protein [Mycena chlorophos]
MRCDSSSRDACVPSTLGCGALPWSCHGVVLSRGYGVVGVLGSRLVSVTYIHSYTVLRARLPQRGDESGIRTTLSPQEHATKLLAMRITLEELDQTVEMGTVEVAKHVKFASDLMVLARKAEVDTTHAYIGQVRTNLPAPLRKLVSNPQDWPDFVKKIKEVDRVRLREEVQEAKEQKEKQDALERRVQTALRSPPATPMTKLANQMGSAGLKTPKQGSGAPAPRGDTFGGSSGGRGNLFAARELSAEEIEKLRALVNKIEVLPDTPKGREHYAKLVGFWDAEHGRKVPRPRYEDVGYPIAPGTFRPGQGECFRCGRLEPHGHSRDSCTAEQISDAERTFRSVCHKYLFQPRTGGQFRSQKPKVINFLEYRMGDSDDESDAEGFGEGSHD